MKTLLVAIPTYHRAIDIDNQLACIHFLSSNDNVHIVVFDSSLENQTEKIIESKQEEGFSNISYERFSDKISSNEKVFLIYEKCALSYDYIWVLHDHTIFTKEAFDYVIEILQSEPDFIFLKMQGNRYSIRTYADIDAFASSNAWLLGKMGASIIRSNTMLSDIDWDFYKRKYLQRKTINFSHVGLYLERISEVDKCKVVELEFPRDQFVDTHKFDKLSWEKEALRICTECWGSVITVLPDIYTNKGNILHTIDKYFLSKYKLIEGRYGGYYDIFLQIRYRKWIKIVFPNLYLDSFKIAIFPKWLINYKYISPIKELITREKENGKQVYIYGAGKHGVECMNFLEMADVEFDGFLVSSRFGNPEKIRNYKVEVLKEKTEEGKPVFAILAVMDEMQRSIIDVIKEEVKKGADISWVSF